MLIALLTVAAVETPVLVAIITALFVPLGAYLVAVRQFSGRVESSDAKELWAESRSIREWSQQRINQLESTVDKLDERVNSLERYNTDLHDEKRRLQTEAAERDATIRALNEQVADLTNKLERANQRIAELERNGNGT